jgi:hypothetical protein
MSSVPDEIVPDKSTSTILRNTLLTYKHDSAGSFSITGNQLNRVYGERGITQSCTGRLVRYYFVRTLLMSDEEPK